MIETWCLVIEVAALVLSGIREIKSIKFHGEKFSKISWGKYLSHEIKSIYFHNVNPTWDLISVKFHIGTTPRRTSSATGTSGTRRAFRSAIFAILVMRGRAMRFLRSKVTVYFLLG